MPRHIKFRVAELRSLAKMYGLEVESWTPGDGVRRFQFYPAEDGSREVSTVQLGIREAETFLEGWIAAHNKRGWST